jgi:hypothetical protein
LPFQRSGASTVQTSLVPLKAGSATADSTTMARDESAHRPDVRYRLGRWLGETMPSGIFAVLLLASVGFPLAAWFEWLGGGPGEPLGVEVVMALAWLACVSLAYAWWFSGRQPPAEPSGSDSPRRSQ